MAAAKGNKYGEKFKTPAQRREAYLKFCAHVAAGFSKKSFHDPCVENTIMKLINDHPDDCPPEALEIAEAEGRHFWEKIGIAGTMGQLKGFNPSSWIFNMKNRLGWKDRQEHSFDQSAPAVFKIKMGKDLSNQESPKKKPKKE